MQIVSIGDNLHEMSNSVSGENKKNISVCHLLKFLPRMLSVNSKTKVPIFLNTLRDFFSNFLEKIGVRLYELSPLHSTVKVTPV